MVCCLPHALSGSDCTWNIIGTNVKCLPPTQATLQALLSKCPVLLTRGLSLRTPPHPTPTLLLFTLSGVPTPNRTLMHRSVCYCKEKVPWDCVLVLEKIYTDHPVWWHYNPIASFVLQALLTSQQQGTYYTQPLYAAPPHVIHHTTVVQPNGMPAAMYGAPMQAPRPNGVAMGMVAGTTMAMSAGELWVPFYCLSVSICNKKCVKWGTLSSMVFSFSLSHHSYICCE